MSQQRIHVRYSESFKMQVISELESEKFSNSEQARIHYGIATSNGARENSPPAADFGVPRPQQRVASYELWGELNVLSTLNCTLSFCKPNRVWNNLDRATMNAVQLSILLRENCFLPCFREISRYDYKPSAS